MQKGRGKGSWMCAELAPSSTALPQPDGRAPRDGDWRSDEAYVYGFPDNTTRSDIQASLNWIASEMVDPGTITSTSVPYSRGNRGVLTFSSGALRDEFVAWYRELAPSQRPTYDSKGLVVVKQKPAVVRRRAARLYESERYLKSVAPSEDTDICAVPGRNVIVSGPHLLAQLDRRSDEMAYDWAAISTVCGTDAARRLRAELD